MQRVNVMLTCTSSDWTWFGLGCLTPACTAQATLEHLQEAAPGPAAELQQMAAPGQMQDLGRCAQLVQEGCWLDPSSSLACW